MHRSLLSAVLSLSVLLSSFVAAQDASAQQYIITDLGSLGGTQGYATAVNASGQVVGYSYMDAGLARHAFSWTQAGGMIDLGTLGGTHSNANAVNASGQIVGQSYLAGNATFHAFSWTQESGMIDLGTLGGTDSTTHAVNASGQVVGSSFTGGGAVHAFSWTQEGGMVDLGTLGGTRSEGHAVNDSGQVVGVRYTDGGAGHAFSWTQEGGMVDLGTLGGSWSYAMAVNASGQVVGYSATAGNAAVHAFSWTQESGMIDLGTLGGTDSQANEVNASGQIVGYSFLPGDTITHAVLWQVSSEPVVIDIGPASLWIGLKNSDDQGTAFDLQAEVAIDSVPVATARTLCIVGVTRNPDKANKAVIQFEPFLPVSVVPDAVFSLTIRTRIGTNPNGTKCPGHSNAVGLRLYYEATSQPSRISAQLTPDPVQDFFLHADSSNVLFLDEHEPTGTTAKFKDSASVNFAGGNPWKAIGTWSMTLP